MSAIRSNETRTEVALRKALHARGLRYRKNSAGLVGKPDIIFPSARVAVFVDGDYWHGRRLREDGIEALRRYYSASQQPYWIAKMQRNVARDDFVTAELRGKGWLVLRYWESNVKKDLERAADRITRVVQKRRNRIRSRIRIDR